MKSAKVLNSASFFFTSRPQTSTEPKLGIRSAYDFLVRATSGSPGMQSFTFPRFWIRIVAPSGMDMRTSTSSNGSSGVSLNQAAL